jgi:hypothetical protein
MFKNKQTKIGAGFEWWLSPRYDRPDFGSVLLQFGFIHRKEEAIECMSLYMHDFAPRHVRSVPDFKIQRIAKQQLQEYFTVVAISFGVPLDQHDKTIEFYSNADCSVGD